MKIRAAVYDVANHDQIQSTENTGKVRIKDALSYNKIEPTEIEDILQEVRKLESSDVNASDPARLRNIAITHQQCEHVAEAIEQFEHLLEVDTDYLHARVGLARTYAMEVAGIAKPDWEKALSYQDTVIEHVKNGKQLYTDTPAKSHLKKLLLEKALWLRKLERFDEARDIYLSMLEEDPDEEEVRLQYLFTLCETQNYGAVVETMDHLNVVDEKSEKNRLTQLFLNNVSDDEYHSNISHAFKQVNVIPKLQEYCKQCIH